jgi:DNA-binding CsgD family transcriptional regulator
LLETVALGVLALADGRGHAWVVSVLRSPRLVGRERDLAGLKRLLDDRGGCAVVLGEAGIGKSRLLREFAGAAQEAGLVVLSGRAVATAGPAPYRPLAEALITACRRDGVPQAAELIPYRPVLGRLIPEWAGRDVAVSSESTVALAEGVLRMLRVLGGEYGAVLLVEDVHWCDPETAAVLEYLADHAAEESLRVVVTSRRPAGGPGAALVRSLADRRIASAVELPRLTDSEVSELAAACLDVPSLPAGLEDLLARGDGVPFLIEELLAAAVACGALARRDGRWTLAPGAARVLPRTFVEEVARRLEVFSPEELLVPAAAALLGRRVDVAVLAQTLGRAPADLAGPLERCVAAQLLVRDVGGWAFPHALTQDAVLVGVAPPLRVELAGRARAAVEAVHPGLPGPLCYLAAELDLAAGDADRASATLLVAGRRAVDAGALATADAVVERAATVVSPDSPKVGDIAELRVEAAAAAGEVERAFALAVTLPPEAMGRPSAGRVRVHLRLADAANDAGRWADAREQTDAACGLVDDDEQRALLDTITATTLLGTARHTEAEALARRALAAGQRLGLIEVTCRAYQLIGRVARDRDISEAEEAFTGLLDAATRSGQTMWAARAAHELGTIDLLREASTDRLEVARPLALECGAVSTAATVDLQLAGAGYARMDVALLLESSRRAQRLARRCGLHVVLGEALQLEAQAHAMSGHRIAMVHAAAQAVAASQEPAVSSAAHSARALFALLHEQRHKALMLYDEVVAMERGGPAVYRRPWWYTWSLLHVVVDDHGDEARAEARAFAAPGNPWAAAALGYANAIAAGRRGDAAEAQTLFTAARAWLRPPGYHAQRHLMERHVAECALADGWGEPAAWLADAAGFFHDSGQPHVERACRSLLRRAGVVLPRRHHGHRAVPPALAALGLTDREAEVLALVGEGLTNRDIADRLVISVRTVDKHVERLLAKTGATGRSELRTIGT